MHLVVTSHFYKQPYQVPLHSISMNSNVELILNWTAFLPLLFSFLVALARLIISLITSLLVHTQKFVGVVKIITRPSSNCTHAQLMRAGLF